MQPTLLVMAAGMGSRYGGLKQIDAVGPNGEAIIDYSIYDALRAGFGRLVFVIRRDIEAPFREAIGGKFEKRIAVDYVFQELDKLPAGFTVPPGRTKPWGTTHAILMAEETLREPFAAINADDFYGRESFQVMADFLRAGGPDYAMVGYTLRNTLSEHGSVSRGVCECDAAGFLRAVVELTKVEKHGREYTTHLSNGSSIASDQVMFAIGRHPNVANLGLEKTGVAINRNNGGIAVDGFSRTSAPNIYAIGDVTHRTNLTPVAIREGHAFADTVFGKRSVQVDHADIPTAVFSQPEIGTVGLTEAQARAHFSHVDIYKTDFRPIKSTMSGRDTRVLMKLVVDGSTDRVVGCHVVGDGAAEIAQVLGIAVKMKATKADFDATMALHPTAAEELVTMRTPTARYVRQAAE